jgi:hypothetical protein
LVEVEDEESGEYSLLEWWRRWLKFVRVEIEVERVC